MKTSLWKTFSSVADRPIRIKFDTESHAYDDRKSKSKPWLEFQYAVRLSQKLEVVISQPWIDIRYANSF